MKRILAFWVLIPFFAHAFQRDDQLPFDKEKVDSLVAIAFDQIGARDFKLALHTLDEAMQFTGSNNKKLGLLHYNKAFIYKQMFDVENALSSINQSIASHERGNFPKGVADAHQLKGLIFKQNGWADRAIQEYTTALQIYENLQNGNLLFSICISIGNLHQKLKNHQQAYQYYQRASVYNQQLDSEVKDYILNNNLGSYFFSVKDYDSAIHYYDKSLATKYAAGDTSKIASTLLNKGELYIIKGELFLAQKHLREALSLKKLQGDKKGIANVRNLLGLLKLKQGQYLQSTDHLEMAREMIEEGDYRDLAIENLKYWKEFYYQKGNLSQFYSTDNQYDSLTRIFFEDEKLLVNELENEYYLRQAREQTAYETKEKERQIEIAELRASWLIISLVFLFVLVLLLFFLVRQRKRTKQLNLELIFKNDRLKDLSGKYHSLLENNRHFTKNSLTELLHSFHKQVHNSSGEVKYKLLETYNSVQALSVLFEMLNASGSGGSSAAVDLKTYLGLVIKQTFDALAKEPLSDASHIEIQHIEVNAEIALNLGMIVNELIVNAYKHVLKEHPGSKIDVHVKRKDQHVSLKVESVLTHPNEDILEITKGKGLNLIENLLKNLKGSLNYESKNTGTLFQVIVPFKYG